MSILAARASRHTSIRRDHALSDGEIMAVAPSIFAEAPHHSRSDRYAYIPTVDVLNGLRKQGFQPFMAAQAVVRNKDKQEHTRHLLRLRHADTIKSADAAHEIILLNSHDGTSSYQMLAGAFRFVCMNGLVCGDVEHNIRIPHKGRDAIDNVIEGAFTVLSSTKENGRIMEDMRTRNMSQREAEAFASAAIAYRFDGNEVITPRQALTARRHEDNGTDQWSIFNTVQENLVRGGMDGRSTNNRTRRVREITGMDKDTKLNSAIWTMMQSLRDHLGHN
jgi:hypothetical protein